MRTTLLVQSVLSVLSASLFVARSARADVHWNAPAGCPSEDSVRERTRTFLAPNAREPEATVVVRTEGRRFVTEVRIPSHSGETGVRQIDGDTCADLADAVALVLAMSAREDQTAKPVEEKPTEKKRPDDAIDEPGEVPTESTGSSHRWEGHAAIGPEVTYGSLPNVGPGAVFVIGAAYGPWRAEVDGHISFPQRTFATETVGGAFSDLAAGLRACFVPEVGSWSFGGCAGMSLHGLSAEGRGNVETMAGTSTYAAPQLLGLAVWRFSQKFGLRAHFTLEHPLARQTFVVRNVGSIFRVSPITLGIFVGPEVSF